MASQHDEITALEVARARAIVAADVGALAAMTDDDYVHIEASGRQRDKPGFIAALSTEGVRFSRYEIMENRVRFYGDTAVVTGRFENEALAAGGLSAIKRGRHCRVYVRRPTGWRNILHQGTEVRGE